MNEKSQLKERRKRNQWEKERIIPVSRIDCKWKIQREKEWYYSLFRLAFALIILSGNKVLLYKLLRIHTVLTPWISTESKKWFWHIVKFSQISVWIIKTNFPILCASLLGWRETEGTRLTTEHRRFFSSLSYAADCFSRRVLCDFWYFITIHEKLKKKPWKNC